MKPKLCKYWSNSSNVLSLFLILEMITGIQNRKGAEGVCISKHMAEGHRKREKEEMSVSRGKFNFFTSIVYKENTESSARNHRRQVYSTTSGQELWGLVLRDTREKIVSLWQR